jgi:nucleoside-diphosphate-sugar epimerase
VEEMMKIYLTGGTGLLGSHFADLAIAAGARVISLVRSTSNVAFLKNSGCTLSTGDLNNIESLASGMKGCDAVVHSASPIGGWGSPQLYEENTVNGTRNVIAAMEKSSIKTLVHISTVSVHGLDASQNKPVSEANGFGRKFLPYDHYGKAKVKAEQIVKEAHDSGRIQATVLRPGWMFGPRDKNYCKLADMMKWGMAIKIGNGENRLSLVYVVNVANAIWQSLANKSSDYRVYIYAYDGKATQNDYFKSLSRAINTNRGPISLPKNFLISLGTFLEHISIMSGYKIPVLLSRYVVHLLGSDWNFDQSRIEKDLGPFPRVSCEQGFAATEEWYSVLRSIKRKK